MALIGSINEQGELQGQINGARYLTGVITSASAVGGQVVGMRGLQGEKGDTGDTGATGADGQDGADGFSPSASVSKVGDTTTITITDKDGTTTASVYDGKDDVFIAEYGVTTYDEIDDAFIDGKAIILKWQSAGYYRYFPCSVIDTSSSYKLTFLMGESIAYDVEVKPFTPPFDWSYSSRNLQETLVSGTSIKTINNESLLGSGNIDIQSGGASAFIAEYGVTTYADVKDAYDEDAIIICTVDDSGNTAIHQLAYFDDANDGFIFTELTDNGWHWASIVSGDTWDNGSFQFASTDTATQLRNGLMSSLDKQKLDGIASGAEVNVQSDWSEADSTADDYIKNKPNIHNVPSGGTSGQVLSKGSNDDYDLAWTTVASGGGEIAYCTCTDSASTVAKTATLVNGSFNSLTTGAQVAVKFTYTNTATNPTLNVNNTGAKGIRRGGTTYVGTNTNESWGAGNVVILVYDGTDWQVANWLNTTYTGGTGAQIISGSEALNKVWSPQQIHDGIDGMATATPTASKNSKFDSSAHMNSTDMTTGADSELEDFIDGLNVVGHAITIRHEKTTVSIPSLSARAYTSISVTPPTTTSGEQFMGNRVIVFDAAHQATLRYSSGSWYLNVFNAYNGTASANSAEIWWLIIGGVS